MTVSDAILRRLERRAGLPGLVEALTNKLKPDELTSLMLAVLERRTASLAPSAVLQRWESDAFVRPSSLSASLVGAAEAAAFAAANAFERVELSPLCPLGTCTTVAPVDQGNVVGTARSSEVVADPTNVLALECSVRRRARLRIDPRDASRVRLATSHRVVRAQRFSGPAQFQHFQLFAACTAGRDEGNHRFEQDAVVEHATAHVQTVLNLRDAGFAIPADDAICVGIQRPPGARWADLIAERLRAAFPGIAVELASPRASNYYPEVAFRVVVGDACIGDGGVVPWTAALLSNRKERLCIGGLGLERASALWGGAVT